VVLLKGLLSALLLTIAATVAAVGGERAKEYCPKAVLSYDRSMPVSKVFNYNTGDCIFTVGLPPKFASADPWTRSGLALASAAAAEGEERSAILRDAFVPSLLDGTSLTLKSLETGGSDLLEVIQAQRENFVTCASDALAGKSHLQKFDSGSLACGVKEGRFALALTFNDFTFEFATAIS
jgi:hypothetical protein